MRSAITGFTGIIAAKIKRFPSTCVVPANLNSDVIENIFCQQRGICHGENDNPTYKQFMYGMNTIIVTEDTVTSRKCNTGKPAFPFGFSTKEPLKKM